MFPSQAVDYIKDRERTLIDKLSVPTTITIDAESYKRHSGTTGRRISIKPWVTSYDTQYPKDLEKFKQLESYKSVLIDTSVNFQKAFVEKYIVCNIDKELGKEVTDPFYTSLLADKTCKYLSLFGMMIQYKEVAKYHTIHKKIRISDEIVDRGLQSMHIGYESAKYIRLYDGIEWINVNKVDLNYDIKYKENDIIVGTLDEIGGAMVFKLRNPIQHISDKYQSYKKQKQETIATTQKKSATMKLMAGDHRVVERGTNCKTKSKEQLTTIALALKIEPKATKVSTLCDVVRDELIKRELVERSKRSVTKYVYFWWNSNVDITDAVD
jgi:hypothetical protein